MIINPKNQTFVHYGSSKFEIEKFIPVTNIIGWNKPQGGLWACDINTKYSWKKWCLQENFHLDRLKTSFKFKLKNNANILRLKTPDDFNTLPILTSLFEKEKETCPKTIQYQLMFNYIDWEHLRDNNIDAIEYIRTPFGHHVFFTWDVDSLLVINPETIEIQE